VPDPTLPGEGPGRGPPDATEPPVLGPTPPANAPAHGCRVTYAFTRQDGATYRAFHYYTAPGGAYLGFDANDSAERRVVDGNGRVSLWTRDTNGDGVVDEEYAYSYHPTGIASKWTVRWDGQGTGTLSSTFEERYDILGRVIEATYDWNNDGINDEVTTWTYGPSPLAYPIRVAVDQNGDGTADFVRLYVVDDGCGGDGWPVDGCLLAHRRDDDQDGVPERIDTYRLGPPQGEVWTLAVQDTATGRSWMARDRTVSDQRVLIVDDDNGDGKAEWRRETLSRADGTTEQITTDSDENGDGRFDRTRLQLYDAAGLRVVEDVLFWDLNADGILEASVKRTFDAAGHPLRIERDDNGDGVKETLWVVSTFDGCAAN